MKICAIVLAGGSGTRLWPLSRSMQPKQFLSLKGEESMLQATINRLSSLDISSTIIVTNKQHRFIVSEQLKQINLTNYSIILEPFGRNTAPAAALSAFSVDEDTLLLILSADHIIQDQDSFSKMISEAISLADSGKLITFGIKPKEANTNYGYIKKGEPEGEGFRVDKFIEKPSQEDALKLISDESYFWNSGMFLFKASSYLNELQKLRPDIHSICKSAIKKITEDLDFIRIDEKTFESCPNESIDYAVMEKTDKAVLFPMQIDWNDVGSWTSLWEINEKDENNNVSIGDVMLLDSKDSYIQGDERLIAAIGLDNLVIISTKDALMVSNKNTVHKVKEIVEELKTNNREEWQSHLEVFRPWGKFISIDKGNNYQVKRITVKPGAKLSLQMHHHRSEHWVVVSGEASVTKGEDIFTLNENESTYIPPKVIHSIENTKDIDLEIIEVQSGEYLGEDDIVRFEDIYGREDK